MNWAIFFHLNFFSRFARQKTKIFLKFWILFFWNIYFEARIARAGLNVALILLYQYLKRNPAINFYFSIFWQKTKFLVANYHFWTFISQKQTIFRQNLFGDFYSTLNFLSNGIHYVKFLSFKIFFIFLKKSIWIGKKNFGKFQN